MDKKEINKDASVWQLALHMFGQVSTWIVVPIVLALILGKSLDAHWGTKPFVFLGFTGIAFVVSIFGIVKIAKKYLKSIEDSNIQNKNGNN